MKPLTGNQVLDCKSTLQWKTHLTWEKTWHCSSPNSLKKLFTFFLDLLILSKPETGTWYISCTWKEQYFHVFKKKKNTEKQTKTKTKSLMFTLPHPRAVWPQIVTSIFLKCDGFTNLIITFFCLHEQDKHDSKIVIYCSLVTRAICDISSSSRLEIQVLVFTTSNTNSSQ